MFSFLKKNPTKQMEKEYQQLVTKAFQAQRNGDIRGYSELTAQAEAIKDQIDSLKLNA